MKKRILKRLSLILFFTVTGCAGVTHRAPQKLQVTETKPVIIRVAIAKNIKEISLITEEAFLVKNGVQKRLSGRQTLSLADRRIFIQDQDTGFDLPVSLTSRKSINMNGKAYFGEIIITEDLVLNVLPVEEYLKGVLSSEISDDWPEEVLKTQAIVSRTYAYNKILAGKDMPYDVDDTTMYQKFDYNENNAGINRAISDTSGIIILYKNKPIEAFFHACSGGITESAGDIFQVDLPYLRSFPDPYCSAAGDSEWTFRATEGQIKSSLKGIISEECESLSLKEIRVYRRTGSRRVGDFLLIFDNNKKRIIKGNTFRLAIGPRDLKSLLIQSIRRERTEEGVVFLFTGRGYGHGVGLSQVGAKEMAERGFMYRDIIAFYYRGTTLGSYY